MDKYCCEIERKLGLNGFNSAKLLDLGARSAKIPPLIFWKLDWRASYLGTVLGKDQVAVP